MHTTNSAKTEMDAAIRVARQDAIKAVKNATAEAPYSIAPLMRASETEKLLTVLPQEEACQQAHRKGWIRGFAAGRVLGAKTPLDAESDRQEKTMLEYELEDEPPRPRPERVWCDDEPD
jgi:hypothetical protein